MYRSSMNPGSDSSFHYSTSCLSPMKVLNFRMILSSTDAKWDLVVVDLLSKFPSSEVVPEVVSEVSKFPILQQLPSLPASERTFDLVVESWALVQLELTDRFRLIQTDLAPNLRRRRR